MTIALLAVLGVDLIVIVVVVVLLAARRTWVVSRPGAFKGAIRVVDGEVDGFRPKWKSGFGRWVSDVLVWTKGPTLLRSEAIEVDRIIGDARAAGPDDKVKRVGKSPVIVAMDVAGARIEIAVEPRSSDLVLGTAEKGQRYQ